MRKEDLREDAGFPAATLPCFTTNSDRGELKSQEIGSTASLGSMPASVPPQPPGVSPEVFLAMVHRLMEEQQQRHAEQQTVLTQLYQELRQSVGGLRDEVQQIGVSLERLQRGRLPPHAFPPHTSKTTTSSGGEEMEEDEEEEGGEAGGQPDHHHHHGTDVPPTTLRTPRPQSPSAFSKTMAGVTTSEGTHPRVSGMPHDHHTWGDKPMKGETEGEMGSAAKTTREGRQGSGVEVEKQQQKRPEEEDEDMEDIQSLSNVGPLTPQRRPHLPSAAGSENSTLVSAHSSVPFDTPVGRRMPAGMRGVDHEEELEEGRGRQSGSGGGEGVVCPRPPPPFTPLQRGTDEKEDPMQLMKTPTAKVGTQHRAAAAAEEGEEEELGRSILEEMSRELERDGHSRSSHYSSHSLPSALPSYTPNHHHNNGLSGASPASRNAEDSIRLAATHTSVSSCSSSGGGGSGGAMGGKPIPATSTTPTAGERGRGGMGGKAGFAESLSSAAAGGSAGGYANTARGVQRGSGGGGAVEVGTRHTPTYASNALSALEHQIQEASAHYNEIFEKIAASPLSAGWMPMGGGGVDNGSGGVGSRASPISSSSSLHSPPGAGVPSLWLEGASSSPFLSGAGAAPSRGGGGGNVSHMGSGGSHTSAMLHTPTPTGRSATAMTTPSQGPLSSPTPHTNTSLHAMNQFAHPSSSSLQQQLHGSNASNFMINSTTNSFVSLDPGTANASGIEMSQSMLGARPMMMRSIHGDGGTLSPSYHSGTGGSMIGGGTNTSTSSGSVLGMQQRKNSTSGIGMLSTDVSGITAEEISAMEMLQGLSELPCTNGITVTYLDDRPRVHAQAHPHPSTAPPPRRSSSQGSKPTGSSSTQHPSQSSSGSTASSSMHGKKLSTTATADAMSGGGGRKGATEDGDAAGASRGISDSYASSAAPMTCVFAADRASPSTASTEDVSIMDEPENFGLPRHQPYHVLVEFKRHRTVQYESDAYVAPGKFVLVGADRGEDLGLVICTWYDDTSTTLFPSSQPSPFPLSSSSHSPFSCGVGSSATHPPFGLSTHPMTTMSPMDSDATNMLHASPVHVIGSGGNSTMSVNVSHTMSNSSMNTSTSMIAAAAFSLHAIKGLRLHGAKLPNSLRVSHGSVLRLANHSEISQLYMVQAELERRAMDVCQQRVLERKVPMVLVYAEYQYDCKKLTFFYEAQQRTDFRELVRDLYKSFRARIWMEPVEDSANF